MTTQSATIRLSATNDANTYTAWQTHNAMLKTVRAHALITSAARTTTRTTAARVIAKARHAAHDAARLAARNMAMYRTNLDRAREIIRANK